MLKLFHYNVEERLSLLETALGLQPADTVISGVNLVEVNMGEVLENVGIVLKGRRIAGIVEASKVDKFKGPYTLVIDGKQSYAIPGFIDLHVHIESSLLDPLGFSKVALRHGTTTVVADPHEVVNVLGLEGFKLFSEAAAKSPLKILLEVPSCVPPTSPELGLETPSAVVSSKDVESALGLDNVIGLGEVMDFISVLRGNREAFEKIRAAHEKRLLVDGHAPMLCCEELNAYIAAGILSDHESTSAEEALEKARRGMYVYMRQGSAWRDLPELVKLVKEKDCKLCAFVSDDVNVLDLVLRGHMDRIVNEAIEHGLDPVKAIQYATINPALRLHLEDHIGIVAPGRLGDVVLTSRIDHIDPHTVLANGEVIYREKRLVKNLPAHSYPEKALNTVKLALDFVDRLEVAPKAPPTKGKVRVNVIEVKPGSALTKRVVEELEVTSSGHIKPDAEKGVMYVGVINRHCKCDAHSTGFVKGLPLKAGAIAQTIAHDTHNLIYAGWSESDIKLAIKRVVEIQGGIVVVANGSVVSEIPLKLAGLMSIEEPEKVLERYIDMVEKLKAYGVDFEPFFMTLSLVSLPVIPELRITDRGLVDVKKGKVIPLIAES
ncbi:MAG: adenine deaminase [Desulfurococcaceae archaeon]